jgi:hypothetical protein
MVSINKKAAGVAAVAAAAVIGLGVANVAQAEDSSTSTPSPTSTSSSTDANRGMGGRMGGMGGRMDRGGMADDLAADLASKLGVDQAKVETAIEAVRDDLRAQHQAGDKPSAADRDAMRETFANALAKELGVDATKVSDALDSIQQARQAERFADHEAELTQRLADAVKAGTLTQAESDAVLKAAKAGIIGMGGGRH